MMLFMKEKYADGEIPSLLSLQRGIVFGNVGEL
jgi:hypothetical protein